MTSRFGPADDARAAGQPGADGDVAVAGQQRRDQRQQRVEVGREVDVHVGDDRGVARRPRRAQRAAAALLRRGGRRARRAARAASACGDRPACASVLALSAIVIRHGNGKRVGEVGVQAARRSARGRPPRCRRGRRCRRPGAPAPPADRSTVPPGGRGRRRAVRRRWHRRIGEVCDGHATTVGALREPSLQTYCARPVSLGIESVRCSARAHPGSPSSSWLPSGNA